MENKNEVRGYINFLKGTRKTAFDKFVVSLKTGLQGTLSAMAREGKKEGQGVPSFPAHLFGVFYDFCQFYSYALYPLLGWGKNPAFQWLLAGLSFRNPFTALVSLNLSLGPAVVAIVWALMAIFVFCGVSTIHGFATGKFNSVVPLKVLRFTGSYIVVLQITLVERMASVFPCGTVTADFWQNTSLRCTDFPYQVIRLLTAFLLLAFLLFSLVVSAVTFNRRYNDMSGCYDRHSLGRVELVMIALRAILALVFSNAKDTPVGVLLGFTLTAGGLFFYLYTRFLPDIDPWRNKLQACLGAAFFYTSLLSLPAVILSPEYSPLVAMAYFIGLPGAVAATFALVSSRLSRAELDPTSPHAFFPKYPTDVEVMARSQMNALFKNTRAPRVSPVAPNILAPSLEAQASDPMDLALTRASFILMRGNRDLFPSSSLMDCLHANFIKGYPRVTQIVDYAIFLREVHADCERRGVGRLRKRGDTNPDYVTNIAVSGISGHPGEVEMGAQKKPSATEEESAEDFFSSCPPPTEPFPSARKVIFTLLNAGLTKDAAVDVRILLVQALQELEHEGVEEIMKGGGKEEGHRILKPTPLQVVQVEKLSREAASNTVKTMVRMGNLWNLVLASNGVKSHTKDLLMSSLRELSYSNRDAVNAINYLSSISPHSHAMLCAKGCYSVGVLGDLIGGSFLFTEAGLEVRGFEVIRVGGLGELHSSPYKAGRFSFARSHNRAESYGLEDSDGQSSQLSEGVDLLKALSSALHGVSHYKSSENASSSVPLKHISGSNKSVAFGGGAKHTREAFYSPLRLRARLILSVPVLLYAAAIGVTQWLGFLFAESSREILSSGDRHVLMERLVRRVVVAARLSSGLVRPSSAAVGGLTFNSSLRGLASDAEALGVLHRGLFSTVRDRGTPEEGALYTSQSAISMVALEEGVGDGVFPYSFSASFDAAVIQFAGAAASLATLGPLSSNFSLWGSPTAAFFLVQNGGLFNVSSRLATELVGERARKEGITVHFWARIFLFLCLFVPLGVAVGFLLVPTYLVVMQVEGLLEGLVSGASKEGSALGDSERAFFRARSHLSHIKQTFVAFGRAIEGDVRLFHSLLRIGAGLSGKETNQVIVWARPTENVERDFMEDSEDGTSGFKKFPRPPPFCTACFSLSLTLRVLFPLFILLCYNTGLLWFSMGELERASKASSLASTLASIRGSLISPANSALITLTDGLTSSLRFSPSNYTPSCNTSSLASAEDLATTAVRSLEQSLNAALSPSLALNAPTLTSILLTSACNFVSIWGGSGRVRAWAGADDAALGLPILDCTGGVPAGAPSSGVFFGYGYDGVVGLLRTHAQSVPAMLRKRNLLLKIGGLESASFLLTGNISVYPPSTDSRGLPWPCPPPLLDQPSLAWRLDASLHQLVEPALRGAVMIVLDEQAAILGNLLLAQSVSLAVMPILAAIVYYTLSLPHLNHLDELLKMGILLKNSRSYLEI